MFKTIKRKDKPVKNRIEIKYSSLTSLYLTAKGFQNNYEHLKMQLVGTLGKISYENPMPVAATNGYFALELYLKLIYAFEYWEKNERYKETPLNSTKFYKGHNLKKLFENINGSSQEQIVKGLSVNISRQDIMQKLDKYKNSFMEWRYFFEGDSIVGDFVFLSDILNSLYRYCERYMNYKHYTNEEWSNDYPHTSTTMYQQSVNSTEEVEEILSKDVSQVLFRE